MCPVILNIIQYKELSVYSYSYVFELFFIGVVHVFIAHGREMMKRKLHNREKMIEVEIKRTNDLLSNLVPPPVLYGIKSD